MRIPPNLLKTKGLFILLRNTRVWDPETCQLSNSQALRRTRTIPSNPNPLKRFRTLVVQNGVGVRTRVRPDTSARNPTLFNRLLHTRLFTPRYEGCTAEVGTSRHGSRGENRSRLERLLPFTTHYPLLTTHFFHLEK
jgi:hypothetical protein